MRNFKTLNYYILTKSSGFRCGVIPPFQKIETTFADLDYIFNISVPKEMNSSWQSASGGIHLNKERAIMASIAESLERYSASLINFPVKTLLELKEENIVHMDEFSLFSEEQYANPNFLWTRLNSDQGLFGEVYSIYNNKKYWVPQELIGLGVKAGKALFPSTSSGLAAHTNKYSALLLATQEILERDALTVYWLNSLGGIEIKLEEQYLKPIHEKFGQVFCFDITQAWNPHPVVVVYGFLPKRNKKRVAIGVACRKTYKEAIEKAYLEWIQGVIFAGFYHEYHPEIKLDNKLEVIDFDKHAVYYTYHPELWDKVPLIKNKKRSHDYINIHNHDRNTSGNDESKKILQNLLNKLQKEGIRIYYHDLTLPDVKQAGLFVVRVLSPELSLLHGDERAPFLGGRTKDVHWRYPHITKKEIQFYNSYPHPLG